MKKSAQTVGFTLVELLVSISVIALIAGFMLPGFTGYIQKQSIKQAQEQIKNDLRTAQNRALAGVRSSAYGVNYWGILFPVTSSTYTFFTSAAAGPTGVNCVSGAYEIGDTLNGGSVIKNGAKCIFFDVKNGNAYFLNGTTGSPAICNDADRNSCSISVGQPDSSGATCMGVKVNSTGLIWNVSGVNCY